MFTARYEFSLVFLGSVMPLKMFYNVSFLGSNFVSENLRLKIPAIRGNSACNSYV